MNEELRNVGEEIVINHCATLVGDYGFSKVNLVPRIASYLKN
jgi:hypothetical protein